VDDLIDAVAKSFSGYAIAGGDAARRDMAVDAIAAILRTAGDKPDPVEAAFRAGWHGCQSHWRGARPDEAFEAWNRTRTLTTGQAPDRIGP
jgi:hypothetical protein